MCGTMLLPISRNKAKLTGPSLAKVFRPPRQHSFNVLRPPVYSLLPLEPDSYLAGNLILIELVANECMMHLMVSVADLATKKSFGLALVFEAL